MSARLREQQFYLGRNARLLASQAPQKMYSEFKVGAAVFIDLEFKQSRVGRFCVDLGQGVELYWGMLERWSAPLRECRAHASSRWAPPHSATNIETQKRVDMRGDMAVLHQMLRSYSLPC